ncbi:MAG TPA: DUF1501 domain-containing protein [Bacteroidia bacterium]|nr:DUF1501 domain-containing protein [Bacteroidia bacterium]
MKKVTRKEFIGTGFLAGCSLLIPKFLKATGSFAGVQGDRKLIVVQLSGGNDGLNTIIPYRNDIYYSNRPVLSYKTNEVLPLSDELGFNPSMKSLRSLFEKGDMCILNNVGYPDPDRSHFRSMDIWQTASGSNEYLNSGWLGRYLDATCNDCSNAHLVLEADDMLSLALKGKQVNGMAVKNPERLWRAVHDPFFEKLSKTSNEGHHHELTDYLYKTALDTQGSVDYLVAKARKATTIADYPDNEFGKNLKMISGLIGSGCETRVYYVSLTGFDTHARQKQVQERLLETLSDGLNALVSDLKQNGHFNNTLIMTFSEFGRRVKENGSAGTDHGAANNLMLLGGSLKKTGFYNAPPDLQNLQSGDVAHTVDFRNVYATVLEKWLQTDPSIIITQKTTPESFI